MDVSVIIVNYNTKDLTKNCIDSIFEKTSGVTFEVILVDNASTDGSVEAFKKDDRIRFIESGVNLGFGKANNLGYQCALGNYIFLLNSDTLLLNNAIKEFYMQMEQQDTMVACMGCLLVDACNQPVHSYGDFPTMRNELLRKPMAFLNKYFSIRNGYDDTPLQVINEHCFEVEYVTGADIFMRKEVADRLGLFDSEFFMYYEECEMQYRYRRKGYISLIIDNPKVMHLVGKSDSSNKTLWTRNDIKSMFTCYRKLYGRYYAFFFKWLMIMAYLPLAICDFRHSLSVRRNFVRTLVNNCC